MLVQEQLAGPGRPASAHTCQQYKRNPLLRVTHSHEHHVLGCCVSHHGPRRSWTRTSPPIAGDAIEQPSESPSNRSAILTFGGIQ
jgi:hypothetical protein